MNILFATSQIEPFASTGTFGETVRALAVEHQKQGHEVSVVVPFYRSVREDAGKEVRRTGAKFSVPVGPATLTCEVREMRTPEGIQVFCIDRDEFFDRSGFYGMEGRDYQDNSARFTFFAKCVIELALRMDPVPDVIHAHNWQAALVPVFAAHRKVPVRTVLTAHTLEFQGNFWSFDFGLTNLPGDYFSPRGLEYYGSLNFLKGGILAADAVVVPGPRFAAAAQTKEHGCGLDPVMREQAGKIEGIAPGLEADAWDPAKDSALEVPFASPEKKLGNRKSWFDEASFEHASEKPAIVVVPAAMDRDGMELLLPAIDRIVEAGSSIAILGDVESENLAGLLSAERRHSGWLTWIRSYDDALLHRALAGSDILLSPAAIEPNATILRKALRYGVLPVSMACRGLGQIVPPYHLGSESAVGFAFHRAHADAVTDAVRFASLVHADRPQWNEMVSRAMAADFSWTATAERYSRLYQVLVDGKRRAA